MKVHMSLKRVTHIAQAACLVATLQMTGNACAQSQSQPQGASGETQLKLHAADVRADATRSMLLGATRAGSRIVAVGEHGIVLLSDDNGATFRQAKRVPANSTLTSVTFVDAQHGWAAGHWGVVVKTDDAGETWTLQRSDTTVDQPLFSIAFRDTRHGWAVGLWSLLLTTDDGGATWTTRKLDESAGIGKSGLNLYSVFAGAQQDVYVAAEQGTVMKSTDNGATWQATHTGYKGTLWSGTVSPDNVIYVGGLRGNMFESRDGGTSWAALKTGVSGSVTDLVATPQGIAGVALDGFVMLLKPGQTTFTVNRLAGRDALTALVMTGEGSPVLFSKDGVIAR